MSDHERRDKTMLVRLTQPIRISIISVGNTTESLRTRVFGSIDLRIMGNE